MSDPLETLKGVIRIFENSESNKEGLFDAQAYIFTRHPELAESEAYEGFELDWEGMK